MTRKHMEAFAEEIRERYARCPHDQGVIATEDESALEVAFDVCAEVLRRFNPRFDRERFFRACFIEK